MTTDITDLKYQHYLAEVVNLNELKEHLKNERSLLSHSQIEEKVAEIIKKEGDLEEMEREYGFQSPN